MFIIKLNIEVAMNKYIIFILILLTQTACGTMTRGTKEAFTVTSNPSNAEVKLSTGEVCNTPCTLQKKRKQSFTVTVSKDGYKSTHSSIVTQVAGAGAASMAGNILVGGFIGAGVDLATGASLELVPNPLHVILDKKE